jgi:hypothetical protein
MKAEETASTNGGGAPVEIVTVPALGPEWQKSELRGMTKSGRKEEKYATRREKWKAWNRDQRGMCGRHCTRQVFVFTLFGICAVIGLVLGFTIPRVPAITINNATPIKSATGNFANSVPVKFSRAPANFSFPAIADLQVNTQANWLPLTINSLHANVFDLVTAREVGRGEVGKMTFPAKAFPRLSLPLNFTYLSTNDSDQTWKNWYDGCKNRALYPEGIRPALKFRLHMELDIAGLPTKHSIETQVSNAECPIELAQNAA